MSSVTSRPRHARERSFGLSVGGALVVVASVLLWREQPGRAQAIGAVGALLVVLGGIRPSLLFWPSAAWWRLAGVLGYVNARILLSILFTLVMTPIGLIWRASGRDPLGRRRDRWAGWTPHPGRYRSTDHYTRMY